MDISDVGYIVFASTGLDQHSLVQSNVFVSAGNSAHGAYAADERLPPDCYDDPCNFTGTRIDSNQFWTSAQAVIEIGLWDGAFAFYGVRNYGTGAQITNNNTAGLGANVNTGAAISGMLNTTFTGNDGTGFIIVPYGNCPRVPIGASLSPPHNWATGVIQPIPPEWDVAIAACVVA